MRALVSLTGANRAQYILTMSRPGIVAPIFQRMLRATVLVAGLFLVSASILQAQGHVPVCDTDCTPPGPNQGSPGVQVPADRGLPSNQRGLGNVFSAATTTGGTTTVQGSSSYTYKVPMYALPGRAGLDLNLTMYYNSHIWVPD